MSLGGDQQLGANQLGSRCPPNFYPTSTRGLVAPNPTQGDPQFLLDSSCGICSLPHPSSAHAPMVAPLFS